MARPRLPVQASLFSLTEEWEHHWKGMPEFDQRDLAPLSTRTVTFTDGDVYVHFESGEDEAEFTRVLSAALRPWGTTEKMGRVVFSEVVGQDVTGGSRSNEDRRRTQSIWYPEAEIGRFSNKTYVHRDNLSEAERALIVDDVLDLQSERRPAA